MKETKSKKPATHDEYLEGLPADQRAALGKLRMQIRAAAPDAAETISYGICTYRLGRMLVGYGAVGGHCSFFLMSNTVLADHSELVAGYDTSTGTIRFSPGKPLPAALVRTLIRARLVENAAKSAPRNKKATR
jgi:uncharacterized protein YdhG (YjbR/CyaY superfamily)